MGFGQDCYRYSSCCTRCPSTFFVKDTGDNFQVRVSSALSNGINFTDDIISDVVGENGF